MPLTVAHIALVDMLITKILTAAAQLRAVREMTDEEARQAADKTDEEREKEIDKIRQRLEAQD